MLIVYGTLLDDDLRAAVLGRRVPVVPLSLRGWRRVFVRRRSYPTLIPWRSGYVAAARLDGLDDGDWQRLIAYEGAEYALAPVHQDGLDAKIFLAAAGLASQRAWTLDAWRRRFKPAALRAAG